MQTSILKSSYHMLASTGSGLCLRQQTDINWFAGVELRTPGESPF